MTTTQADGDFGWSDTESSRTSVYQTGVMHYRSEIGERRISDGLTKTYLAGEKYLNSQLYEKPWFGSNPNTADWGDNQSVFAGFEMDNHRLTKYLDSGGNEFDAYPPRMDHPQISNFRAFGRAHPGGWHVVMCDGSVHSITYDIDAETHRRLGHRADGEPVELP